MSPDNPKSAPENEIPKSKMEAQKSVESVPYPKEWENQFYEKNKNATLPELHLAMRNATPPKGELSHYAPWFAVQRILSERYKVQLTGDALPGKSVDDSTFVVNTIVPSETDPKEPVGIKYIFKQDGSYDIEK